MKIGIIIGFFIGLYTYSPIIGWFDRIGVGECLNLGVLVIDFIIIPAIFGIGGWWLEKRYLYL